VDRQGQQERALQQELLDFVVLFSFLGNDHFSFWKFNDILVDSDVDLVVSRFFGILARDTSKMPQKSETEKKEMLNKDVATLSADIAGGLQADFDESFPLNGVFSASNMKPKLFFSAEHDGQLIFKDADVGSPVVSLDLSEFRLHYAPKGTTASVFEFRIPILGALLKALCYLDLRLSFGFLFVWLMTN
jgi:hypothetical protein